MTYGMYKIIANLSFLARTISIFIFKKINNQIDNPAQYNEIKKNIARLYTTIKNTK